MDRIIQTVAIPITTQLLDELRPPTVFFMMQRISMNCGMTFLESLQNMEDYQRRVEGLTSVITAIISISSDEQARKENQSITRRLTTLAIVFVPLSFSSGLFSMQTGISQLRGSIKLYFIISASFFGACTLPLGLVHLIRWGIAQRV
jgi:Mg2+ and Co2+ transporter CorA